MKPILTLLSLLLINVALTQTNFNYYAAFAKESFFYPSREIIKGPLHPTWIIGIQNPLEFKKNSSRSITLEMGGYHHAYFENGFFLLGGYQFHYFTNKKLSVYWKPEAGYLHTWSPTGTFRLDNGKYQRTKNIGRPNLIIAMATGLEYRLTKTGNICLYSQIKSSAAGPFAIKWGVPVVPYTFVIFGVKSNLKFK